MSHGGVVGDHDVSPELADAAGHEIRVPVKIVEGVQSADQSRIRSRKGRQVELHAAYQRVDSALNVSSVVLGRVVEHIEETRHGLQEFGLRVLMSRLCLCTELCWRLDAPVDQAGAEPRQLLQPRSRRQRVGVGNRVRGAR